MNRKSLATLLCTLFLLTTLSGFSLAQASTSTTGSAKTSSTAGKKKAGKSEKIDINSASKDQLQTLSGIGDATAQKIIDGRPYKRKNELVSKKIISKSEYDKVRDKIIAKQSK
jgi:competence protein ComEA